MDRHTKMQNAFTMTWIIENFSYCVQQTGEYVESPEFTDGFDNLSRMQFKYILRLYPRGHQRNSSISVALQRCGSIKENDLVHFSISVVDTDGLTSLGRQEGSFLFTKDSVLSDRYDVIKRSDMDEKKLFTLPKDVLTIQCVIKKDINDIKEQINRTRFIVEEVSFDWCIKNVSSVKTDDIHSFGIPVAFGKVPRLFLELLVKGEFCSDAWSLKLAKDFSYPTSAFHSGMDSRILPTFEVRANIVKCSIFILDSRGDYRQLVECSHLFVIRVEAESFPLPFLLKRSDLLPEKDLLLENDELKLRVNLKISDGSLIAVSNDLKSKNPRERKFKNFSPLEQFRETIFKDVKFCDMTFRIESEEIHAHKVVICSQSPVFCKMFECDMTEKTNSVVEITDVDLDIMKLLVRYMYTGQLDDGVDLATAANLYSAAHKYQVLSLIQCCSLLMCSKITFDNVWDALSFAAKYEDTLLKKAAKDLIANHPRECLNTENFETFLEIGSQ